MRLASFERKYSGWTYRPIDGPMDSSMDGFTDGPTNPLIEMQKRVFKPAISLTHSEPAKISLCKAWINIWAALTCLWAAWVCHLQEDIKTYKHTHWCTDQISPHCSTGHRHLSGPLPKSNLMLSHRQRRHITALAISDLTRNKSQYNESFFPFPDVRAIVSVKSQKINFTSETNRRWVACGRKRWGGRRWRSITRWSHSPAPSDSAWASPFSTRYVWLPSKTQFKASCMPCTCIVCF